MSVRNTRVRALLLLGIGACGGRSVDELGGAGSVVGGAAGALGSAAGSNAAAGSAGMMGLAGGDFGGASLGGASFGGFGNGSSGGASSSASAGDAGDAGAPSSMAGAASVPPEVSQRWAWRECGRVQPDPHNPHGNKIDSLALSADGAYLATSSDYATTLWHVARPFEATTQVWRQSGGSPFVDVSRGTRQVAQEGEATALLDPADGSPLPFVDPISKFLPPNFDTACLKTEFRFSPDGSLFAGKSLGTAVLVYDTHTFQLVASLETYQCGQGIAFSPDGLRLATPEATFDLKTLKPVAGSTVKPPVSDPAAGDPGTGRYVTFTADGSEKLITECAPAKHCVTHVGAHDVFGGRRAMFSSEGHWLVSGGFLFHRPSSTYVELDPDATEAVFTPEGDVIAGEVGSTIARYCRVE